MINEFVKLLKALLLWILAMLGLSLVFFIPIYNEQSVAVKVFQLLKSDLIPVEVELIVTSPLQAFLAQVGVSLALAFVLVFPLFLLRLVSYLAPALYEAERKVLNWILLPSTVLFLSGCAFAYYYIIPVTFKLLYEFADDLTATSLLLVNEFTYLVFGITLVTGFLFLLPVCMVILSFVKVVSADFWFTNWRFALVFFLIFSAIITPDGSGVTMLMLLVPLSCLYVAGSFLAVMGKNKDLSKTNF